MAISELKQRLLKYELSKAGFPDAEYIPENRQPDRITEPDKIRINSNNHRMPEINNAGDIKYGREFDSLVVHTIKPLVSKVNEMHDAWEQSSAIPFEEVSQYRIPAEYNGVILAARNDAEYGRGLYFATWQYDRDRTGLNHGHYTEDYAAAKEDFAVRSGLVDKAKIINEEQAAEIVKAIENLMTNDLYLTNEKVEVLSGIAENLRGAYPEKSLPSVDWDDSLQPCRIT